MRRGRDIPWRCCRHSDRFFTRPISAVCLGVALFLLVSPLVPRLGKKREELAVEEVS